MANESEKKFIPVKLTGLIPCKSLDFDVYLHFPVNGKYIKYLHEKDHITEDSIEKFKLKNIQEIYVTKEDLNKYLSQMGTTAGEKISQATTKEEKSKAAVVAAKTILQNIDHLKESEKVDEWTNNCIEVTKKIAEAFGDTSLTAIYDKLKALIMNGSTIQTHSLTVCSLSSFLGMANGISEGKFITELSLGGLLHDVGLSLIKPEIADAFLFGKELKGNDLKELQEHTIKGVAMLEEAFKNKSFSENVKKIVLEHHENASPTGYPNKLPQLRQSLLPKIVAIADRIALIMLRTQKTDVKAILESLYEEVSKQNVRELDDKVIKQLITNLSENFDT